MKDEELQPTTLEILTLRAVGENGDLRTAAGYLGISFAAINHRLDRMRAKYRANSTTQLVFLAATRGWFELDGAGDIEQ